MFKRHPWIVPSLLVILGLSLFIWADYDGVNVGQWDVARPAGSEYISTGPPALREIKRSVTATLGVSHYLGGLLDGQLKTNAVQGFNMASNSVGTAAISNEAVTLEKMAPSVFGAFTTNSSGAVSLGGGLMIQWGQGSPQDAEATQVISFSRVFSNEIFQVIVGTKAPGTGNDNNMFQLVSATRSNVTVFNQWFASQHELNTPTYIAIGY